MLTIFSFYRFGGGPRFLRYVIEIRGTPQVEIYRYNMRVTYMKRPDVIDPDDFKSMIPSMQASKFEVSRKSTIREMRAEFFEAFDISAEKASSLALFNYLDDTMGEVLEDFVDETDGSMTTWRDTGVLATVHSVRLVDTQSLLIDNKPSPAPETSSGKNSEASITASSANGEENLGADNSTISRATSADDGSVAPLSSSKKPSLKDYLLKPSAFPRGICGLRNLGNTCFMNSALQCLSATEGLMEFFATGKFLSEINKDNPLGKGGELATEFGKLMSRMWSGKEATIIPRDFKWMLGNFAKRFDDFSQQDSHELLAFLLDGLHEDCNRILTKPSTPCVDVNKEDDQRLIDAADLAWTHYKARNDSQIVDLFQAQLKSRLECSDCGYTSITFDPFMYLSLPIPTDSIRTRDVLFAFRGGLLRCAIQLPRNALMSQVKQQIAQLTGVNASRIVLADVHASKVHRKFHNQDRFDSVSNSDHLVAYELQYDISKPMIGKIVVPVFQRLLKPEWDAKLDRWGSVAVCTGIPTFVMVDKHITYGDLFNAIKRQIGMIVDMNDPAIANKRHPFSICKIKLNGQTNHKLEEWRHGSSIERQNTGEPISPTEARNLHLVIHPGDVLSVDWDISIASAGQQPAQGSRQMPRAFPIKDHPDFAKTTALGAELATKPVSLDDCFKAFVKPERLDGTNSWRCPDCKVERDASKAISIWTLPDILVVHLKRFTETIYTRQKLTNKIEYPVHELDLAPYIAARPEGTNDPRQPILSGGAQPCTTKYNLFAVSNHYGDLNGGHYTAITQNFVTGKWLEYDDANAFAIKTEDIISGSAYVLFYKRVTEDSEPVSAKL